MRKERWSDGAESFLLPVSALLHNDIHIPRVMFRAPSVGQKERISKSYVCSTSSILRCSIRTNISRLILSF